MYITYEYNEQGSSILRSFWRLSILKFILILFIIPCYENVYKNCLILPWN